MYHFQNISTNVLCIYMKFSLFFTVIALARFAQLYLYMYFNVLHASTRGQSYNKPWNFEDIRMSVTSYGVYSTGLLLSGPTGGRYY